MFKIFMVKKECEIRKLKFISNLKNNKCGIFSKLNKIKIALIFITYLNIS